MTIGLSDRPNSRRRVHESMHRAAVPGVHGGWRRWRPWPIPAGTMPGRVRRFGESGRLGKSAPQILPSSPARAGSLAAEQGHSPSRGSGVRVGGVPGGEDLPPLTEAAGGQVTRSRPYARPSPRHAPAGRSSNGAAGHADRPSGAGDVGVGGEFAAAVRAGEPHHQAAPRPAALTPVSERAVGAGAGTPVPIRSC